MLRILLYTYYLMTVFKNIWGFESNKRLKGWDSECYRCMVGGWIDFFLWEVLLIYRQGTSSSLRWIVWGNWLMDLKSRLIMGAVELRLKCFTWPYLSEGKWLVRTCCLINIHWKNFLVRRNSPYEIFTHNFNMHVKTTAWVLAVSYDRVKHFKGGNTHIANQPHNVTHKRHLLRETKERSVSLSERIDTGQENVCRDWNRVLCSAGDGGRFQVPESVWILGSWLADGGAKLQCEMFSHNCWKSILSKVTIFFRV